MDAAGQPDQPFTRLIDLTARERQGSPGPGPPPVSVLLIQSDPLFADLVAGILDEAGITVDVVPRLTTALARLVRDHVDVVLTDLELPDSTGPETVRFLRSAAPDIPIIVLAGIDDIQIAVAAIQEGADEYVVRSRFSARSLIWLVRLVIERHRRVAVEQERGTVDPTDRFADRSALQVIGRHLMRVTTRAGLHLGVILLAVEPASRGPWADLERLTGWVGEAMERTLRRCDLLSRLDHGELAALLVSESSLEGAVTRLEQAIVGGGAGQHVRLGFAAYDPHHPVTLEELLNTARAVSHPILA